MRSFILLLAGVVAFGLVRLAALPPLDIVHHHANWALWIDGRRVDFSADRFMEDVTACDSQSKILPENRVHMHDNNPDVVHVHHGGATWGHLLLNLGWGIGKDWIVSDTGEVYRTSEGETLHFILNGFKVPPAHNRTIEPGDRLLISFGSEEEGILMNERFPMVASDAPAFDTTNDPAGCSGHAEETLSEKARRAFWF